MKQCTKCSLWAGRIMSGLSILLLLMDSIMKILQLAPVMQGTAEIGFPARSVLPLGLILFFSTLLYIFPRTAFWGALLITGYLGAQWPCTFAWEIRYLRTYLLQFILRFLYGAAYISGIQEFVHSYVVAKPNLKQNLTNFRRFSDTMGITNAERNIWIGNKNY